MDKFEQIEKIKRRLGVDGSESDEVIVDLFDDTLAAALACCNLKSADNARNMSALLSIVRESTAALFNQRGNEGTTGYNTGGQGASYEPVYKVMREKLIGAGCRVWR